MPRLMRDRFGRRLKIYMDTAYERGTSDFYEQNVKPGTALVNLPYCSGNAGRRSTSRADLHDWIAREITDFTAGPNGLNVIAGAWGLVTSPVHCQGDLVYPLS